MSSGFVAMGLLVVAGFSLGLMVGWLAWRSPAPQATEPESTSQRSRPQSRATPRSRPTAENLPEWRVQPSPAGDDRRIERRSSTQPDTGATDPTVVIGARTFDDDRDANGRAPQQE